MNNVNNYFAQILLELFTSLKRLNFWFLLYVSAGVGCGFDIVKIQSCPRLCLYLCRCSIAAFEQAWQVKPKLGYFFNLGSWHSRFPEVPIWSSTRPAGVAAHLCGLGSLFQCNVNRRPRHHRSLQPEDQQRDSELWPRIWSYFRLSKGEPKAWPKTYIRYLVPDISIWINKPCCIWLEI